MARVGRFLSRQLALTFLLLVGAVCLVPTNALACEESVFGHGGKAQSCHKAIRWYYDSRNGVLTLPESVISVAHPEPQYVHVLGKLCDGTADCEAAHTCPSRLIRQSSAYYLASDDGTAIEPALGVETVCVSPGATVPISVVAAAAHEEIRKRISAATLASAPAGKTLINIITIYSTTPQPEPRIDITTPVPGSIVAVPEYRWDFGDGLTAVGPGLPYQAGDDPAKLPGKYLGPIWRTGGTKHVTLTVTWRVRFLLEGLVDVPLAPIVFTATEDKQVATARAVLVNR